MIIYGSRMYWRRNVFKGWGTCEHCGRYGKYTSYNGRKWGHLYFIPIVPMGGRVRVVKQCARCSTGMHIKEDAVPAILEDMLQSTTKAVTALVAGQEAFEQDGSLVSAADYLASAVEMLFCLDGGDHVRFLQSLLLEKGLTRAYHLVSGESLEVQGRLDEAAAAYRAALAGRPDDPGPHVSLGEVCVKKKDFQGARAHLEKALELAGNRLPVLQSLLGVYESLGDHHRLAGAYEECFTHVPLLRNDKKVVKAYRKACRKAGRQPVTG